MNINAKCRIIALAAAAMAASAALAMPTKGDFVKAQPVVTELMNPLVKDFKAEKTTAEEVGAKAVEYAREAETEAAKFLLLKGAITYYARAEKYDKAADAVDELGRVVKDIPPDTMLDIISRATSRISEANAPRLHAQYRLASSRAQAEKEIAKLKPLVAKRPADDTLRRRYAEALAASGNWKAALDEFAKAKGTLGEIAAAEKSGKGKAGDVAEFWWGYKPEEQYVAESTLIKWHAAEFYKKALAEGSLSGLKKTLAEKRVASLGPVVGSGAPAVAAPSSASEKPAVAESNSSEYCVIDVSKGPNASKYDVTYLSNAPQGGWTNDDRTKKIVLRRVKAGEDPLGRYSISKDYYIGVFEITQKQWEYVMGKNPAENKNDVSPATMVSVADIRGVAGGDSIGRNGFAGKLAAKSCIAGFDLPTEVQWEYAWRVGAATKLDAKIWERCRDNDNPLSGADPVGDMSGSAVANCKYDGQNKPKHAHTNKINPKDDRGFRIVLNLNPTVTATSAPAAPPSAPENPVATDARKYCVIDISKGPDASKYDVTYLSAEPKGGWTDEYKTTKLVLRRIEPGKFKMLGKYDVILTKPFYCGIFEVTQKQYELVKGNNPSRIKGDMLPVGNLTFGTIRGDSTVYDWPIIDAVDSRTFVGRIQARTGLKFDLPTEAQWEYACRAGTTSRFNNGGDSVDDLKKLGRFKLNWKDGKDGKEGLANVGMYQPNAWGLYDMHGNAWERCLDRYVKNPELTDGVTDPVGPPAGDRARLLRGGCHLVDWTTIAVARSGGWHADGGEGDAYGFRLFLTLSK